MGFIMIIEFNTYDDDTFYYHYITDDVRICTDGYKGVVLERRDFTTQELTDLHLDDNPSEETYFQLSTINEYVDETIKALYILNQLLQGIEYV
jgi:hypothetical protein